MRRGPWVFGIVAAGCLATAVLAVGADRIFVVPSISVSASDLEALEAVDLFDDPAPFLAQAGTLGIEDFEDEAPVGTLDGPGVDSLQLDTLRLLSDREALKIAPFPVAGNHNVTPGGSRYVAADTGSFLESAAIRIQFDAPVTSFGFWATDLDSGLFVRVNNISYLMASNGNGGESFFGLISDAPFTSVDLTIQSQDGQYSLDDIYFGGPCVPSVGLTANSVLLQPGDRLVAQAEVANVCAFPIEVEEKAWGVLPNGAALPLQDSHTTETLAPGSSRTIPLVDRVFDTEPAGTYTLGVRLLDPVTGEEIVVRQATVSYVIPPP